MCLSPLWVDEIMYMLVATVLAQVPPGHVDLPYLSLPLRSIILWSVSGWMRCSCLLHTVVLLSFSVSFSLIGNKQTSLSPGACRCGL